MPAQNRKLIPEIIAGINIDEGLENTIDDEQLYFKVLKSFYNQFNSTIDQFNNSPTLDEGRHLSHSLKGVCLTIGAIEIAEIVTKLESSYRNGESSNQALIDELEVHFSPMLADLAKMFQASEDC